MNEYFSFIANDYSAIVVKDLETCIDMMKSELESLLVGETQNFSFEMVEMTEEEFENLPEWEG